MPASKVSRVVNTSGLFQSFARQMSSVRTSSSVTAPVADVAGREEARDRSTLAGPWSARIGVTPLTKLRSADETLTFRQRIPLWRPGIHPTIG